MTSHWSGTVAVDARRPAPDERDPVDGFARRAPYIREVTGGPVRVAGYGVRKLRRFISRAGGLPGHSGKDPTAHIHWIRHERPDMYAATAVFLEPADYLNLRLTGRACSSYDCIALHWVADIRDLTAVHLRRRAGADVRARPPSGCPSWCPRPRSSASCAQPVAAEWGLRGGHTGGDRERRRAPRPWSGPARSTDYAGHIYIGTSSWLSCHVPWKRTDLRHNQTTLPSALPGRYFVANEHETAGACLTFLADNLRLRPHGLPTRMRRRRDLRGVRRRWPPAPRWRRRVVFTPWLNGERTPVDDRPYGAASTTSRLTTTRADLVRSVFEGIAYNSRWLLDAVERFIRRPLPALTFIGGGARSGAVGADPRRRARPHDPPGGRPAAGQRARGGVHRRSSRSGWPTPTTWPGGCRSPPSTAGSPQPRDCYDELYGAFTEHLPREPRVSTAG